MVVRDGECLLDAVDLEGVAQDREGLGRLLLHLKQLTLRIRTRSHHLTITNTPGVTKHAENRGRYTPRRNDNE